jgi:lysophospholipase L1-like esterase
MSQRLIALGDSITLGHWDETGGWLSRLREASDARVIKTRRKHYAVVYNLGVSSDASTQVLARYRAEVDARHKPTDDIELFIVCAVGVNDSAMWSGSMCHFVEPAVYDANMRALAKFAREDAGDKCLIVGPTPVDESRTTPLPHRPEREYRLEYVVEYNAVAAEAARSAGVEFVDLFEALRPHHDLWRDWDGVHLNAATHKRVAEILEPRLATMGWGTTASESS